MAERRFPTGPGIAIDILDKAGRAAAGNVSARVEGPAVRSAIAGVGAMRGVAAAACHSTLALSLDLALVASHGGDFADISGLRVEIRMP